MLLFFLKCSAESFVDALFEDKIPITESLKNIEQAPFSKIFLGYSRTGLFFQAQLEKKFYFVLNIHKKRKAFAFLFLLF